MNAAEMLLMFFSIWVALYFIVGIVYGIKHMRFITHRILDCSERDRILKEKVAIYDMTPAGAAYYTELQELHITEAELLFEHKAYKKKPKRYKLTLFVFGMLFWVYYLTSLLAIKSRKAAAE